MSHLINFFLKFIKFILGLYVLLIFIISNLMSFKIMIVDITAITLVNVVLALAIISRTTFNINSFIFLLKVKDEGYFQSFVKTIIFDFILILVLSHFTIDIRKFLLFLMNKNFEYDYLWEAESLINLDYESLSQLQEKMFLMLSIYIVTTSLIIIYYKFKHNKIKN